MERFWRANPLRMKAYAVNRICPTMLALFFAVFLAAPAPYAQAQAPEALETLRLDSPDEESSAPAAAAAPNGAIACAWIAKGADGFSVVFRESIGGVWGEPERFRADAGARPSSPVLLYDAFSNPHLIWCLRRNAARGQDDWTAAGAFGSVEYAFRAAGVWVRHGALSDFPSAPTSDPAAAMDAEGTLHAVWREGAGAYGRIVAASLDSGGRLRRQDLTAGRPPSLNLYPAILPGAAPQALWYSQRDSEFGLEARRWSAETREWLESPPPLLDWLPASRLPLLFGGGANPLFAIWHEPFGEIERVVFGRDGAAARGAAIADDNPGWPNSQPFGTVAPDGSPVVCWLGEGASGPAVHVRKASGAEWLPSAALSRPRPPYPAHPIAAAASAAVHVFWLSRAEDGGTGGLYTSAVRWPPPPAAAGQNPHE